MVSLVYTHVVCLFWIKCSSFEPWPGMRFTLIVPLSTRVYKWLLANLMPGLTLQWISVPVREDSVEIGLVAL